GAHIKYWEIWNEPHNAFFWTGTFPQMVRMTKDAASIIKSIDPDALIISPPVGLDMNGARWLEGFLAAGGGDAVDIISFHGYIHSGKLGARPSAPVLLERVEIARKLIAKYGQGSKPLWDTEASW